MHRLCEGVGLRCAKPTYELLDISSALRALAGNAMVRLESPACITAAVSLYVQGPASFADCLLALKARQAGCDALRSFDRKMRGLPGVELL